MLFVLSKILKKKLRRADVEIRNIEKFHHKWQGFGTF